MDIITLYELQPIGVDGALEAVNAYHFCTELHREVFRSKQGAAPFAPGLTSDPLEGTCCDHCGKDLDVR